MEDGGISSLFRALVHVGTVQAVRQEYRVFRTAEGRFVVFSPSNRGTSSFHMSLVDAERVEALAEAVTNEGVTSGSLMKDDRLTEVFGVGRRCGPGSTC
jgi:ferredoxin-fold anticodon binding domain-containing protein